MLEQGTVQKGRGVEENILVRLMWVILNWGARLKAEVCVHHRSRWTMYPYSAFSTFLVRFKMCVEKMSLVFTFQGGLVSHFLFCRHNFQNKLFQIQNFENIKLLQENFTS